MFYDIPELPGETPSETNDILVNFLKPEMKISTEEIEKVQMDKIHRNGKPGAGIVDLEVLLHDSTHMMERS